MAIEQGVKLTDLDGTDARPVLLYGVDEFGNSASFPPAAVAAEGLPVATNAEATAGTRNDVAMTPSTTKTAISNQVGTEFAPLVANIEAASEAAVTEVGAAVVLAGEAVTAAEGFATAASTSAGDADTALDTLRTEGFLAVQKKIVTTAGQRNYATAFDGQPLEIYEGGHILFGGAPFGPLSLGVDYTVVSGQISLNYDPAEGELLTAVCLPRVTNSEAQALLQDYKDEIAGLVFASKTYTTKSEAEADTVPAAVTAIMAGGRTYVRDELGQALQTQGGVRWRRVGVDHADIMDFDRENALDPTGATTSDPAPFRRAVDWLVARGGGVLHIPPGKFNVLDTAASARSIVDLSYQTGIHVRGAGIYATTIRCADGHNGQGVLARDSIMCSVRGLTFDCNKDGQTSGYHGVRLSNVKHFEVDGCYIKDPSSYGITYNPGGGDFVSEYVRISNCIFSGSVADAIDGKNSASGNKSIIIQGNTILSFGLMGALSDGIIDKAGIDVRGPCRVLNNTVYGVSLANTGIRCRWGEVNDGSHGYGGHETIIDGFHIYGDRSASADNSTLGLLIAGRNVKVTNGIIEGCAGGLNVNAEGCAVSGVTSINARDYGIRVVEASRSGKRSTLTGCTSLNAGINNFRISSPDVTLQGCKSVGSADGFWIDGVRAVLTGCSGEGATGQDLNIRGSATGCRDIGGTWQKFNNSAGASSSIIGQVIRA